MSDLKELMEIALACAKMAGQEILEIYHGDEEIEVTAKADKTPLTTADQIAHDVIIKNLPMYPILSEESELAELSERQKWKRFWLVDPLDGTKEFLERTGEFSVNIALIESGKPILGVVFVPVAETMYFAAKNQGSFKYIGEALPEKNQCSQPTTPLRVALSRRHNPANIREQLASLGDYTVIEAGSSLKFCLIAGGDADLYPRLGPTSQWDTAAGQCVLEQAGGFVVDQTGQALSYIQQTSVLNPKFYAFGSREIFNTLFE